MAARDKPEPGSMKGGVRRPRGPNGTWSFSVYLGMHQAQRCQCGHRVWIGAERLDACPKCGGELNETREPRQMVEGGFALRKDAELARAKIIQRLGRGSYTPPERMTLGEYLRDRWLPAVQASGLKRTTKEGYERHVRYQLIGPAKRPIPIALVEMRKLNLEMIRDHYRDLMKGYEVWDVLRDERSRKVKDKDGQLQFGYVKRPGIALPTIKRVQACLHGALKEAVELGMLDHNPAQGAVAKKKLGDGDAQKRDLPAWSGDELQAFLESQESSALYPLWRFIALTGCRRGEACGIRWRDVDLDGARATIRCNRVPVHGGEVIETETKTNRVRVIDLDPDTVDVLRTMRRDRAVVILNDREAHVFTTGAGEPMNPNTVSYRFREAVKKAKIRHIPLHGLRHTHISQLVAEGLPIAMVAARAGHSSPNVTLGTYSHYMPGQQASAVQSVARFSRKRAL